jgi:hypothetical protein
MSSKRKLKKDINYVTYELLTESFTLRHFHPTMDEGKFESVIRDLVNKRNELIARINQPELKEGETLAQYYRKVRAELTDLVSVVEKFNT